MSHSFSILSLNSTLPFRPLLPIHRLPPLPPLQGRSARRQTRSYQESRTDCREPTDPNLVHSRQDRCRAQRREEISDHIIPRNDLRAIPLHHIQTIRVQAWEAEQLRHALQKHHDDG